MTGDSEDILLSVTYYLAECTRRAAKTFELNTFSALIPAENVCESKPCPNLAREYPNGTLF